MVKNIDYIGSVIKNKIIVLGGKVLKAGIRIPIDEKILPADEVKRLRLDRIIISIIPPYPSRYLSIFSDNNLFNMLQLTIQQNSYSPFVLYEAITNSSANISHIFTLSNERTTTKAYNEEMLTSPNMIISPNATTVISLTVTSEATYTQFIARLVFEERPMIGD